MDAVDATDALDMSETPQCVICGRYLPPDRTHVDTCSERCYSRLLERQRWPEEP